MKIRGNEVIYLSPNGNVAVSYSVFDLGDKYKIHKRQVVAETGAQYWRFETTFPCVGQAVDYAKKIFDGPYVI